MIIQGFSLNEIKKHNSSNLKIIRNKNNLGLPIV